MHGVFSATNKLDPSQKIAIKVINKEGMGIGDLEELEREITLI